MSETWELSIEVEVDGDFVTTSCSNTQHNLGDPTWDRDYDPVQLSLSELSDAIKEALGFAEE